jgi:Flp pilus assembly pilin Flp
LSRSVRIGHAVIQGAPVITRIQQLWKEESGQDVAEYAVMLAVILVIVIGTVKLIGSNANNVFSQVGSQLGQ